MLKLKAIVAGTVLALAASSVPASAAVLGPDAAACEAGRSAMLVHVIGLKSRSGTLRIQSYGGNPERFFEKGAWLKRIDIPVPAAGPVEVCVPVARGGRYAISVRHDVNGSGKSDRSDGGGMSGNPSISMFDLLLKRKPSAEKVSVSVNGGVVTVPIVMNYIQGGSFKPLALASR